MTVSTRRARCWWRCARPWRSPSARSCARRRARCPAPARGDAELAALAREVVGPGRPALAVAAVTADGTRTAVLGAAPDTRFEIGSITKGLTGLLFADMIARGEVTPTTTVGALLPVPGPLAAVTLEQLATHRSGLPSVPGGAGAFVRGWWSTLTAGNPYPYSTPRSSTPRPRLRSTPRPARTPTSASRCWAPRSRPPRTGRTRSWSPSGCWRRWG